MTANADITLIERDGRRDLIVNGHEYIERVFPPEPMPELLPDEVERGYVLYSRPASDGVLPRSRPRREEVTDKLATFVTPGETRHVQFTVFALQDLGDVSISVSDLAMDAKSHLPAPCFTVRPVLFRFTADYDKLRYAEIPKILDRPSVPTGIGKGQNQTFWVTLRTPKNVPAGKYVGAITVSPATGKPARIELTVDVLPFQLDEGMWWGIYYYSASPGNPNIERDFIDMKNHGMNSILYCPHPPDGLPPFNVKNGKIEVDFTHADKVFGLIKKHGFRGPIAYYPRLTSCRLIDLLGKAEGFEISDYYGTRSIHYQAKDYPEELKPVLADVFRQMVTHAKKAGWPEILWYLVDEPNHPEGQEYQWAQLEYSVLRQVAPKARTLCTVYKPEVMRILDPWVDVRVCDLWTLTGDVIREARNSGDPLFGIRWICQRDEYWWARYVAGLLPEKLGLDGMTEWTYYGASERLADPYTDLRGGVIHGKDISYSYVSPKDGSLLPTIVWEAVQEGIDDGRYVHTLRNLMASARKSKSPLANQAALSAQKTLDSIFGPPDRSIEWWNESNLNSARRTLADEIIKLRQVLKEKR